MEDSVSNIYTISLSIEDENDFCASDLEPTDLAVIDGWVYRIFFGEEWTFSLSGFVDTYSDYYTVESVNVQESFIVYDKSSQELSIYEELDSSTANFDELYAVDIILIDSLGDMSEYTMYIQFVNTEVVDVEVSDEIEDEIDETSSEIEGACIQRD